MLGLGVNMIRIMIALLVTLLANVAVMAHAVIPHHHHNDTFTSLISQFSPEIQQRFVHLHSQNSHKHFNPIGIIIPGLNTQHNDEIFCTQTLSVELIAVEQKKNDIKFIPDEVVLLWFNDIAFCIPNVCIKHHNLRAPPCLYL